MAKTERVSYPAMRHSPPVTFGEIPLREGDRLSGVISE